MSDTCGEPSRRQPLAERRVIHSVSLLVVVLFSQGRKNSSQSCGCTDTDTRVELSTRTRKIYADINSPVEERCSRKNMLRSVLITEHLWKNKTNQSNSIMWNGLIKYPLRVSVSTEMQILIL